MGYPARTRNHCFSLSMVVLTGMAASAALAVTVSSLEALRSQRQRIEDLEDTLGDLQQQAQQFEGISKLMSAKRQEAHETTKGQLSRLDEQHSAKEQKIAALQEQLEDMLTTVNVLTDKAAHFEDVPKMFSLKRRESDLAMEHQATALQARANEKGTNFEKVQMNMRCMVEQLQSFAQRVAALEAAQQKARRHARRQARYARLSNMICWPRLTPTKS